MRSVGSQVNKVIQDINAGRDKTEDSVSKKAVLQSADQIDARPAEERKSANSLAIGGGAVL